MKIKKFFVAFAALAVLASCKSDNCKNDNFFQLRGIVLAWDDVVADPSVIDWLGTMQKTGLNTISIFGHDYYSPEYAELKQKCIDMGIEFEYEEHGMTWMLPRDLFAEHPEYFRMNEKGERVPDYNGCPSNPEALAVVRENVKELAKIYSPSHHRYYFWLNDGGDKCHCPKCEHMNLADQGLLFENAMIEGLREVDPEAMLAHLAYDKTTPAPLCVKPSEGIFLEFAPIDRCHERPLTDSSAYWPARPRWNNGDYVRMLKDNIRVFGAENAQVLEYWLDDSLFSMWEKPQSPVRWFDNVFYEDLDLYASLGIRNITSYGAWIDDYYAKTYGDLSFIDTYGTALRDYKPEKKQKEITDVAQFNTFHAPWSSLDDETQFRCYSDKDYVYFFYNVVDSTITLSQPFTVETDVNPEDRIEIFFCPDAAMSSTYYCAEIDPLGRVMDYSSTYPRQFDYDWDFNSLEAKGTKTESGYIITGKVAKKELKALGMNLNALWMGIFRDDFGSREEPIWYSVIPTDDVNPDFHKPDILFKVKV